MEALFTCCLDVDGQVVDEHRLGWVQTVLIEHGHERVRLWFARLQVVGAVDGVEHLEFGGVPVRPDPLVDAVGVAQRHDRPAVVAERLEDLHGAGIRAEEQLREVFCELVVGPLHLKLAADVVEVRRFGELVAFEAR